MLSPLLIFMGGALGLIGIGLALKETTRARG